MHALTTLEAVGVREVIRTQDLVVLRPLSISNRLLLAIQAGLYQ